MDLNTRHSDRSVVNLVAAIQSEDPAFTASCVVCNLSEHGAKLIIEKHDSVPDQFVLLLRRTSRLGRRCETIWQIGDKFGVRFASVT
jgi:hypothetical protein